VLGEFTATGGDLSQVVRAAHHTNKGTRGHRESLFVISLAVPRGAPGLTKPQLGENARRGGDNRGVTANEESGCLLVRDPGDDAGCGS
jgi:hypothetical protein